MLNQKQQLLDDAQSGNTELAGGFIDREYKRVCAALENVQEAMAKTQYPILNFFLGTVTTDRLRHENAAQHGGLSHWRDNASPYRQADNVLMHTNTFGRVDYDLPVPKTVCSYSAAEQSTGMGLDGQNLQSFITGTHTKVVPAIAVRPVKTIAPLALAKGAVYCYRSKASATYTDLPALAVNQ